MKKFIIFFICLISFILISSTPKNKNNKDSNNLAINNTHSKEKTQIKKEKNKLLSQSQNLQQKENNSTEKSPKKKPEKETRYIPVSKKYNITISNKEITDYLVSILFNLENYFL